ncbi:Serpentine Receptor, class T [Caenorhabditis elegans]|uniref:Serpentine Receptor, class T n=2 Tax=Caenorhabditis elegans TaxID=6239 RepID=H2KZZ8_CAEEL|nr:Serpentine Receptor, class T [Caenorhabditis elegans]CCD70649.2 Serpentine Receptor, class T [Caenorhabditis elegans]|eukprot:NP_001024245.2 Serpentine Receptor, class T [Caenorhabditis elegans]
MEWLVAKGGDVNAIYNFNCNDKYPTPEMWTEMEGTPHPILGYIDLLYGVIIMILYIPCLVVMLQKENIRLSCFKIMFLLGFVDLCAIAVNSVTTGVLMIEGAVYCSHPKTIFIAGALGLGFWCSACLICLILVLNRVLDILFPTLVKKYFSGSRTTCVLLIPIAYGLYFTILTPPLLFTSRYQAWFFDPFIYQNKTLEYQNYPHTANNLFIVVATCALYGYFCAAISKQFRKRLESTNKKSHAQIFLQSTLICMANFIAAMVYVYMQFFPVADFVIVIGHMSWQLGHGCPAIIYLFMNTTIRSGVSKIFRFKKPINTRTTTTVSVVGHGHQHHHHSSSLQ